MNAVSNIFGCDFAIVAVAWATNLLDGRLHVSLLDEDMGDAALIQIPSGRQILIDGGVYPSILNDHLGRHLPFWDRTIDIIIATHPDADHVAGLPAVFSRIDVRRLITNGKTAEEESYRALISAADRNDMPIHNTIAGEVISADDGVRLEIVNSTADSRPPEGTTSIEWLLLG